MNKTLSYLAGELENTIRNATGIQPNINIDVGRVTITLDTSKSEGVFWQALNEQVAEHLREAKAEDDQTEE